MAPDAPAIGFIRSLIQSRKSGAAISRADAADAFRQLLELTQSASPAVPRTKKAGTILPKLNRVFHHHPETPVGKDGLATRLDLSRFQLYRVLKREVGMSPKEWAMRQRFDQALQLLKQTQSPVSEIAAKVGMPDANYFTRFFRKRTGFSPRDWRRLFG